MTLYFRRGVVRKSCKLSSYYILILEFHMQTRIIKLLDDTLLISALLLRGRNHGTMLYKVSVSYSRLKRNNFVSSTLYNSTLDRIVTLSMTNVGCIWGAQLRIEVRQVHNSWGHGVVQNTNVGALRGLVLDRTIFSLDFQLCFWVVVSFRERASVVTFNYTCIPPGEWLTAMTRYRQPARISIFGSRKFNLLINLHWLFWVEDLFIRVESVFLAIKQDSNYSVSWSVRH